MIRDSALKVASGGKFRDCRDGNHGLCSGVKWEKRNSSLEAVHCECGCHRRNGRSNEDAPAHADMAIDRHLFLRCIRNEHDRCTGQREISRRGNRKTEYCECPCHAKLRGSIQ